MNTVSDRNETRTQENGQSKLSTDKFDTRKNHAQVLNMHPSMTITTETKKNKIHRETRIGIRRNTFIYIQTYTRNHTSAVAFTNEN